MRKRTARILLDSAIQQFNRDRMVLPLMRNNPQQVQCIKVIRVDLQHRFIIKLCLVKLALLVQAEACA